MTLLLEVVPKERLTFLVNSKGAPFGLRSFSKHFWLWCREAGIPEGYTFHGLRKVACRRLAQAGCSAPEIMAISGHKSLAEVQHYIDAVIRSAWASRPLREQIFSQMPIRPFPRGKAMTDQRSKDGLVISRE